MRSDVADTLMRMAAFTHVLKLNETQNNISAEELRRGFTFEGGRIHWSIRKEVFSSRGKCISSFDPDGVSSSW